MKFNIICLLSVPALLCGLVTGDSSIKDEVSKAAKYFNKINEHLEKHVNSDDTEANMAEANKWLKGGLFKLRSNELQNALLQFVLMPEAISDAMCNEKGLSILKDVDTGLFSRNRLTNDNYSLQRVDRLVEHYFEKFLFRCSDYVQSLFHPEASFGWKNIAYEKINKFLVERDLSGKQLDVTMIELTEWYKKLNEENANGALTSALRQFLALQTAAGKESCSYKSYEIMLKNEIATKPRRYRDNVLVVRPIAALYRKYHKKICHDVYPQKFQSAIKQLDEATLRSVVILASEFFFNDEQFESTSEGIDHSKYSTIHPNFTAPEIVTLMEKSISTFESHGDVLRFKRDYYVGKYVLFRTLKLAMTKSNPDYKYLSGYEDEIKGERRVYKEKVLELHEKYLMKPCLDYLDAVEREIMIPEAYDYEYGTDYYDVKVDEFIPKLGFLLGKSATILCAAVRDSAELHRGQLLSLASGVDSGWHDRDI